MLTRPTLLATFYALLLLPFSQTIEAASDTPKKDANPPCTVQSLTTGAFFDLSTISLSPPELKDGRKVHKNDRDESWEARGHDYGTNFTINICAPVIESMVDVVGVDKARWQNVSAYYEQKGKVYSLGSVTFPSVTNLWIWLISLLNGTGSKTPNLYSEANDSY